MVTNTDLDFVLTETPREREEMFPMQEQFLGLALDETEKSAAVTFAECLAQAKPGITAPFLIP